MRAGFSTVLLSAVLLALLSAPALGGHAGAATLTGQRAPEFALKDLRGNYVSVTSLRGKVVLINFWATWCPSCKDELPALDSLYMDYRARGLEVLAVSTDSSEADLRKYMKENPVRMKVLHDKGAKVSRQYGVFSLPVTILVDRGGTIVKVMLGDRDWLSGQMRDIVEDMLGASRAGPGQPDTTPVIFFQRQSSF